MRKNKARLKKIISLFTVSIMLATSTSYAEEVHTEGLQVPASTSEDALENTTEGIPESTTEDVLESTLEGTSASETEYILESVPESTAADVLESMLEDTPESIAEEAQESTEESEAESTTEDVLESTTESVPESITEDIPESITPEIVTESENIEEETNTQPTEEFDDTSAADEELQDFEIYENGEEFVKTFHFDQTIDSNPIYLGMAGISNATGSYYDQLDATSKRIYNQIYEANKNGASTTKISLNLTKIFENQTVTKGDNGKTVYSDSTKQAIFSWLGSYVTPAYLALTYDHPELVWLSGASYNIGYSVYAVSFPAGVTSMTEDIELAGSTFTLKPNTKTGVLTADEVNPLFNKTKTEIDATLSANATVYDKVKAIHDKICKMVSYEDKNLGNSYYQTPYSLYFDADGDGKIETVCAGYAKMMKIQCNKYGIPCVLVTGITDSGEYHMWNYIQMEDKIWYAVDATWDDQSSIMYDFFLSGSDTYSSAAFGSKKFSSTHIPSGKWTTSSDCVFQYPLLSTTKYGAQDEVVKNGIVQDSDGIWRYYKDGKVDTSYTGLVTAAGSQIYMKNGVQDTGYTGLFYNAGNWYYIQKGKVNTSYSGLASYNGNWYYVKGGSADWTYTGLSQYNGIWYYVNKGSINWDYTGLYPYNSDWFYIKNGALDWSYTGLCQYSGAWYYIKKGQVDWNYTGTCIYNGTSYYVENGVLNWKYNSSAVYTSTSYAKNAIEELLNAASEEENYAVEDSVQYASDIQLTSTQSQEISDTVPESQAEIQEDEQEQQSQTQPENTQVFVQTTEDVSLLECIEQYLIRLVQYLLKIAVGYIRMIL